ncbi:hypothetical protein ACP4OV_018398 [Aristida adscensionis]
MARPAAAAIEESKDGNKPEKKLNDLVFWLAFFERAGNAVGTLAFVWATVVLLGGFCEKLNAMDFWFSTVMIFIEATRVRGYCQERRTMARPAAAAIEESKDGNKPEKKLNDLVFWLAFFERVGNAVGTLAFVWATVVLLGGFCEKLNAMDFWFSTVMIFIEATRVFIRNDFSANQWLFGTTRALRSTDFSFSLMLARPRKRNQVAVAIGLCTSFLPWNGLEIIGGMIKVVLVLVIWQLLTRDLLTERVLLWSSLIVFMLLNFAGAGVGVYYSHARRGEPGEGSFSSSVIYYVLVGFLPPIILLPVAVCVICLISKIWRRLQPHCRCCHVALLWLKAILACWLLLSLILELVPEIITTACAMVVLLLGTLRTPAEYNSSRQRPYHILSGIIDLILHVVFFLHLMFPLPGLTEFLSLIILLTLLATLLLGNLQIPVALLQVALSIVRLCMLLGPHRHDYNPLPKGISRNMVPSIAVFFMLALCQGSLYVVASILGLFSFLPRRSLLRDSGLRVKGESGEKAVSLYYHCAYHKHIQEALFSSEKYTASLASFAIRSLSSSSTTGSLGFTSSEMQLAGLCILETFLEQTEPGTYKDELIAEITLTSREAVPTLIGMLGRTAARDKEIRLLAASVVAKLAASLKIAEAPGTVKLVSSLLHAQSRQDSLPVPHRAPETNGGSMWLRVRAAAAARCCCLRTAAPQPAQQNGAIAQNPDDTARGSRINEHQQQVPEETTSANGSGVVDDTARGDGVNENQECRLDVQETTAGNGGNMVNEHQDEITQHNRVNEPQMPVQAGPSPGNGGNVGIQHLPSAQEHSCCCCWQRMKDWWSKWSIPREEADPDTLPVLGMQILERLARDPDNCIEIVKDAKIITEITRLINSYHTTNNENSGVSVKQKQQQEIMICSCSKLVKNLANTRGKTGATLCRELWKNCSLLYIMQIMFHLEPQEVEAIIAKLALDEVARQEIGSTQGIIGNLMHAFLVPEPNVRPGSNNNNIVHSLRMAAGKALVNLTIMSEDNCWAILDEPLTNDLIDMMLDDGFIYVAANLLHNLCAEHSRDKLIGLAGAKEHLESAMPRVMGHIMDKQGEQLEAVLCVASQIGYLIPERFAQVLESDTYQASLVQKLVGTLNANMRPCSEYRRMRRVLIEMVISIVKLCPGYIDLFIQQGVMDALDMVKRTPSRLEKYRVFLDDEGIVVESLTMGDLVDKAKNLIQPPTPTPEAQRPTPTPDA